MILMYHKVYPESPTMWWVTVNAFWKQMEELRRYKVVRLDKYDPCNPVHAVITFDGVYENVFTYAFPILKRFGYPFELFIVGNAIGKGNEFDQPLEPPARFANIKQLSAMVHGGGRLQWHGMSHIDLADISDMEKLDLELTVPHSIKELDPEGFRWFAYPHGNHTPAILEYTRRYFKGALSCVKGNDHDIYKFNRLTVTNETTFKQTTVSLIIPNYNYGRFAIEAIESALRQTVPPDEIIFIDDCSTDNSLEIVEPYSGKIKIIKNERNLGIVRNFNKAVSLTSGEYICLLGADNIFRSDYIERCKFILDTNPDVAVVYTNAVIFGPRAELLAVKVNARVISDSKDIFLWEFPEFNEQTKKILLKENINFIHGSSMFRRSAFEEAGGYIESEYPEDYNLFRRIIQNGWKARLCPEFLLQYRQHSNEQANIQRNLSLELAHYRRVVKTLSEEKKQLLSLIKRLKDVTARLLEDKEAEYRKREEFLRKIIERKEMELKCFRNNNIPHTEDLRRELDMQGRR